MFFRILALCHTVLVERNEDDEDKGENDVEDFEEEGKGKGKQEAAKDEKARGINGLVYQAASPDEAALVEAAQKFGFEFFVSIPPCASLLVAAFLTYFSTSTKRRDNNNLYIRVHGQEEQWELLNVLEFNSDRKRMSVIMRDPFDGISLLSWGCFSDFSHSDYLAGKIKLFCKGADTVIFDRLADGQDEMKEITLKHLGKNSLYAALSIRFILCAFNSTIFVFTEEFAGSGLRTLCLAMKEISQRVYDEWSAKYNQAALQINGREAAVRVFFVYFSCINELNSISYPCNTA